MSSACVQDVSGEPHLSSPCLSRMRLQGMSMQMRKGGTSRTCSSEVKESIETMDSNAAARHGLTGPGGVDSTFGMHSRIKRSEKIHWPDASTVSYSTSRFSDAKDGLARLQGRALNICHFVVANLFCRYGMGLCRAEFMSWTNRFNFFGQRAATSGGTRTRQVRPHIEYCSCPRLYSLTSISFRKLITLRCFMV